MTRRHVVAVLISTLLSVTVFVQPSVAASTVRGRLFRVFNGGSYPVQGIGVTVFNPRLGRSTPSYSGPDGMYYLYNIPGGAYTLEIWTTPNEPMTFQITVYEIPFTDIAPIQVP
jgi:hypothetical protein